MASTDIVRVEPGGYLALNHNPAEIEAIIAENLGGQELGEFDLPRVKIPAGGSTTWEIPGLVESTAEKVLSGVVVHFKSTRAYWPEDDAMGGPPACRSDNAITGVGNPGGPCRTCPMAEFGSGKDGRGQACAQKEVWFILRPDTYLPIVLALPATSLKAAKQYRVGRLGSAGVRLSSVVTDIKLEADKNDKGDPYARAVPTVGGVLAPEEAKAAADYAAKMRPLFDAAAAAIATEDAPPAPAAAGAGDQPPSTPPAPPSAEDSDDEHEAEAA